MKLLAPLLLTTLALASACNDFGFGVPSNCADDDDCPNDSVCGSDINTGARNCSVDDAAELTEDGTCNRPFTRALPFSFEGSTAELFDGYSITCSEPDRREMVFRIEISADRELHVVATDSSGQGIAVELVGGSSCIGPVHGCSTQENGTIDERMTGDTGTNLLVVERAPSGPFTLDLALFD